MNLPTQKHSFEFPTYLVGGAVRDHFMGKPFKDLDFCVVCPSFDDLKEMLIEEKCKIYVETPQYCTIRVNHPLFGPSDFAIARSDGTYSDGRRPDVVSIVSNITEDLSRRAETMNAMAIDMATHKIIDPFGGQRDIRQRTIRSVGRAEDRFREDYLRILRSIRFSITLDFGLSKEIRECLLDYSIVKGLNNVSVERIREELLKMFSHSTLESLLLLDTFGPLRDTVFDPKRGLRLEPTLKL
jgi:tRNA nucleotidyltransferase/poly(A) polymerase